MTNDEKKIITHTILNNILRRNQQSFDKLVRSIEFYGDRTYYYVLCINVVI